MVGASRPKTAVSAEVGRVRQEKWAVAQEGRQCIEVACPNPPGHKSDFAIRPAGSSCHPRAFELGIPHAELPIKPEPLRRPRVVHLERGKPQCQTWSTS
jgi:hypothetical protein